MLRRPDDRDRYPAKNLSAVILIFNTVQLAIFARRREVAVMKLVGATNWFIRIPFMLEGMVQGVVGGFVASVMIYWLRNFVIKVGAETSLNPLRALHATRGEAFSTGLVLLFIGAMSMLGADAAQIKRLNDLPSFNAESRAYITDEQELERLRTRALFYFDVAGDQYLLMEDLTRRILDRVLFPKLKD